MSLSSQADMCINKRITLLFHTNRLNIIMPHTSKKKPQTGQKYLLTYFTL